MNRNEKLVILAGLRAQLGSRIQSGTERLRELTAEGADVSWRQEDSMEPQNGSEDAWLSRLPTGQITEIACPKASCGAGLALANLLAAARKAGRYVVLLDVGRGFDSEDFSDSELESLLWIGCSSITEAISALDIAVRDENFDLFLIDARGCPSSDWSGIPAGHWQRILHSLRRRTASAVVFWDQPHPARTSITRVAKQRLTPTNRLRLGDLQRDRAELTATLQPTREIAPAEAGQHRNDVSLFA